MITTTPPVIDGSQLRHIKRLGYGAYGEVTLVERNDSKVRYAAKRLYCVIRDGAVPTNVTNEINVLVHCRGHANVVSFEGTSMTEDGDLVLLYEPCMGDILSSFSPSSYLPCLVRDITRALHHVHERGCVHLDVKPGNILYRQDNTYVLADFGSAQFIMNNNNNNCGHRLMSNVTTLRFRPPEGLLGISGIAPSCDMWSLGMTILHLALHKQQGEDDNVLDAVLEGNSGELGFMCSVFRLVGAPSKTDWPEFATSTVGSVFSFGDPHAPPPEPLLGALLRAHCVAPELAEVITNLLNIHPRKRWGTADVLQSRYLRENIEI
eukprot:PhM_4_TR18920/c0_g1_i1/m.63252